MTWTTAHLAGPFFRSLTAPEDPSRGHVFVVDGDPGKLTVIDPKSDSSMLAASWKPRSLVAMVRPILEMLMVSIDISEVCFT
jgi:hypothetical protein